MENKILSQRTTRAAKKFAFRILSGSAQGILIGVLPAAILKYVLDPLIKQGIQWAMHLNAILVLFNVFIPSLIGMAIANRFKMNALETGSVMIATGAAAGSIQWATTKPGFVDPITNVKNPAASTFYVANGSGDLINAILVATLAVITIMLLAKYLNGFGSISIILTPLVVGGIVGLLGYWMSPSVGMITTKLGELIGASTDLNPLLMCILLAMAFSFITVTPISTVGIGLAISLSEVGAAAAGVGVISATVILLINSIMVNKPGTSLSIFLGAMMTMMTAVFKKPVIFLAFLITAAISAIPVAIFNVQGTPTSSGLGWIGLGSPIQSMVVEASDQQFVTHLVGIGPALLTWFVVPVIAGLLVNFVFVHILKLYQPSDFSKAA